MNNELKRDGNIVARESNGSQPEEGMHRYTGYLVYPEFTEEIDVDAFDEFDAQELIEIIAKKVYESGYKEIEVSAPHFGFYT